MGDFLTFRRMITPVIIQLIFWILAIASVLGGLAVIAGGATGAFRGMGGMGEAQLDGGGQIVGGILLIILGPLAARIYCELLIVVFRINESLTDVRNELKQRHP